MSRNAGSAWGSLSARLRSASAITCSEVNASISVISANRSTTRLALCSLGEAAPAKSTSASTKTRGSGGLCVTVVFQVVSLALLAQTGQ